MIRYLIDFLMGASWAFFVLSALFSHKFFPNFSFYVSYFIGVFIGILPVIVVEYINKRYDKIRNN
nr:hypothetical protein [Campylobacter sp.]